MAKLESNFKLKVNTQEIANAFAQFGRAVGKMDKTIGDLQAAMIEVDRTVAALSKVKVKVETVNKKENWFKRLLIKIFGLKND
jgi:prefoldin subunit 5